MQFCEKLIFIMNLIQTSNRELAESISADPSLVSRLRTGKRGMPRNKKLLQDMARYFARRCTTDYQRRALAEIVGTNMIFTIKIDQLSELLYYWLCGDNDGVGRFMRTFEALRDSGNEEHESVDIVCEFHEGTSVYYGNEGKRAAARAFYQYLLMLDAPETIFLSNEEADDWMTEDYGFFSTMQEWALHLTQRGFKICQITQPLMSGGQMLESLTRWIPLYMTGQVEAHYYPRLRDNVHRRSIVVVPGKVAVVSNSMAGSRSSYAVVYTDDPKLTHVYETEFRDYLSLCRPMLNIYKSPEDLMQSFIQFLTPRGERIQKLLSLSAETAPAGLLDYCIGKRDSADLKRLGSIYQEEMERLEKEGDKYNLIDIVCLATARQVRDGLVPITTSRGTSEILYYTPETYVLHLKNILRNLETCEHYHFVTWSGDFEQDSALMVKEEHRALLVHIHEPFTVFEISQPDMVALYREYLLRIAEKLGYKGKHRMKIKSQIRDLIHELEA